MPNFTMRAMNCDVQPLLWRMHKPSVRPYKTSFATEQQDKRTVIPIKCGDWDLCLTGSLDNAQSLIQPPPMDLFEHCPADPTKNSNVMIDV